MAPQPGIKSFADVIETLGGPTKFAEAIGIEPFHAQTMKTRDSIPPGYWVRVADAAAREGKDGITFKALAAIAEADLERQKAKRAGATQGSAA